MAFHFLAPPSRLDGSSDDEGATVPLGRLPVGASAVVSRVGCPRALARRLMEMGLIPGTPVSVTRVAPMGDPIQIRVRDYSLSIRRAEALQVEVTRLVASPDVPDEISEPRR
jgi:ferrous iron transport protein A